VSKSLAIELEEQRAIRRFSYPIVYHKDLDPKYVNPSCILFYVPKLICHSVESEMDIADKAVSIICLQNTLENILTRQQTQIDMVHLHYLLVVCDNLLNVCIAHYSTLGDSFAAECVKLKLRLSYNYYNESFSTAHSSRDHSNLLAQ